ncbi:MAG: O-antigen ligase family protein [Thermoanaerobaculia bacterium]|nr:O-antigen ligase family protein [Thermoanaerobaculia bacterium]
MPARAAELRPKPATPGLAARVSGPTYQSWILFLLLHIPLGLVLKASPILATVHALATLVAAMVALTTQRTPEKLIFILGYIVASEALWRTAKAFVFWETGKYALAGLSILALARFRTARRNQVVPTIYFAALLPSILVMPAFDRGAVSFNLSGPFALAMATIFLSSVPMPSRNLIRIILTMLGPTLSLGFVATFSTLTTEGIDFYNSKVASGGLGQNQASSILALGAMLAFLFLYLERRARGIRWFVGAIGIWCAAQAALTFSRGGLVTVVGAIMAMSFFLIQDRSSRGMLILRIALIVGLAAVVVVPTINSFTGGALLDRFTTTSLTGRDKIIEADLIVFRQNPFLGVGPGQSTEYHALTFRYSAAHTEYSRLLAEHGSFGLLALLLLVQMSAHRFLRRVPLPAKAMAAAFTVWSLLYMAHAAMRMSLVCFLFALGGAALFVEYPWAVRARRPAAGVVPAPVAGPLRPAPSIR